MVKKAINEISDQFIGEITSRIEGNKQVRRSLPEWGRLHIDRQLPFLCVYRRLDSDDSSLSERLVMGEASYLTSMAGRKQHEQLSTLVKSVAATLKGVFNSFLIIEVWMGHDEARHTDMPSLQPSFTIHKFNRGAPASTTDRLEKSLKGIKIRKESANVELIGKNRISPPGLKPLLTRSEAREMGCHIIGIEVRPVFRNPHSGEVFPIIRRELQRGFARALKTGLFEFAKKHTNHQVLNYQSLGRYRMVKAVWEVDKQLADICNDFDFILQVSPINNNQAWLTFQRRKFRGNPEFKYRPLPIDPAMAKRRLYRVPIERIEDPSLAQLFREQQFELDRKFTMLADRGTKRFLYGSMQLYGGIEASLLSQAEELLRQIPARSREEQGGKQIDAKAFASLAMQELEYFRKSYPDIPNKIVIRDDVTGLMVSKGNLLIGSRIKIPASRQKALIQHEVGTHILTFINGRHQPFRQLYVGLANYEELQEGLAVLSEYMVGGLSRPRLRLLAARVVAISNMIQGASFSEVFGNLNTTYGFDKNTAFYISMRTFRSGGFTKDAVYLRGLVQLLSYLGKGGELEPLFVGKISVDHVPIIKELQHRNILHRAPLHPRYFESPQIDQKMHALRTGLTPINLIKNK